MTVKEASDSIKSSIEPIYGTHEANAIAAVLIEYLTGLTRSQLIIDKKRLLTSDELKNFVKAFSRLKAYWPVQYITGEAWFAGMRFFVDQRVLIPRPETEELVEWMVKDISARRIEGAISILDIGTGSGCIPIALKKKIPYAQIWSLDVSTDALDVATVNAKALNAEVSFAKVDIADETQWDALPVFDFIVSNPPYIPELEKSTIPQNVLEHEPHLALFVGDFDPLHYYRVIADFSKKHLRSGGAIYLEIHENFAADILHFLNCDGFANVEMRKDLQGKDRMIKALTR